MSSCSKGYVLSGNKKKANDQVLPVPNKAFIFIDQAYCGNIKKINKGLSFYL